MTTDQIISFKERFPSAVENEPLAPHTSWHIGGPARLFYSAPSSDELAAAIGFADNQKIKWAVIGSGTNVLASDDGFDGVVIQAANRAVVINTENIAAESGAFTASVGRQATEAGLSGLEWAASIPGAIGGAIFGNAGCFGGEMKDVVVSVDALRLSDHARVRLSNQECQFNYRDSIFKHEKFVILGCELKLSRASDPSASRAKMDHILAQRKETQPLGQSSAGSVFKNFDFTDESQLEILRRSVTDIPSAMLESHRIAAGWLIDQAGLRGERIGNVSVSEKHGNFFITQPGARAQDVLALISLVKMKVRDEFGIQLQEEIQYLGM